MQLAQTGSIAPRTGVFLPLAVALVMAFAGLLLAVQPAAAAMTTCHVYTWVPWVSGGNYVYGGGTINCDSPDPASDYIESKLYENWGPWTTMHDHEFTYGITFSPLSVDTDQYCDDHGVDDWWTQSRGRDNIGNLSYWYNSLEYSFNCPVD